MILAMYVVHHLAKVQGGGRKTDVAEAAPEKNVRRNHSNRCPFLGHTAHPPTI